MSTKTEIVHPISSTWPYFGDKHPLLWLEVLKRIHTFIKKNLAGVPIIALLAPSIIALTFVTQANEAAK